MEDDLKQNGRRPQKKNERRPKKMEYDLKQNFKKSTLLGCDILVN